MSYTKGRIFLLFQVVIVSLEWVQSISPEEKDLYEIITSGNKRNILQHGIYIYHSVKFFFCFNREAFCLFTYPAAHEMPPS